MEKTVICKSYDFVVVGGGMSGICAAVAAARKGVRTALIQNRPVLGGNASSEMRMHICGADYHMSRPNARETGILEEILLENKRRNPTMNYPVFDAVLWETVHFQEHLSVYLNTHMTEVVTEENRIREITAVQMTTEKVFRIQGTYFMDATGDGTLGFLAGALYRKGREGKEQYGESLAPETEDGCTMGSSLLFQARDAGKPVPFIAPDWANTYTEEQLKFREHTSVTSGYWWIELGGKDLDTISDAEKLRDELLKAVYGVWDHIKNGGDHGAEQMDLEWVGFLPGKRESRRLIGDYVLTEQDIHVSRIFEDAVAYGGWPMDVHAVDGFLNEEDNPTVWNHVEDVYTIPYRCLYSANIENLFLGGRAISCSHIAFSSTRVMGTCSVVGQAVGTAAAIALEERESPRGVLNHIQKLQQQLLKDDCFIPGFRNEDELDLARTAQVEANRWDLGCQPKNVINGWGRAVKEDRNCWCCNLDGNEPPMLRLLLAKATAVREVRLVFDSNLSREITPSIDERVLKRQKEQTPPELIREYGLEFKLGGKTVRTLNRDSRGQRLQTILMPDSCLCDEIVFWVKSTYGSPKACIFEIRAYE